jgi:hypothetical protein
VADTIEAGGLTFEVDDGPVYIAERGQLRIELRHDGALVTQAVFNPATDTVTLYLGIAWKSERVRRGEQFILVVTDLKTILSVADVAVWHPIP